MLFSSKNQLVFRNRYFQVVIALVSNWSQVSVAVYLRFPPPSHHLLYPWHLFQHPRHPIADYKHNRTKKQRCQHFIHLPIMPERSPQIR